MTAIFAWIRSRNGTRGPVHAVVLFSDHVPIREEIVFKRELSAAEYNDDLNTLSARYPAPSVVMD